MRIARWSLLILGIFLFCMLLISWVVYSAYFEVVERTEYHEPQREPLFIDDHLDDKRPEFDPELVDSRPLDDWQINTSAAVIALDCPMLLPDRDRELLRLYPDYRTACEQAEQRGEHVLLSANMIDGVAKQFDDGLVAALETATFRGEAGELPGVIELVERFAAGCDSNSAAGVYLEAALRIASGDESGAGAGAAGRIAQFEQQALSQPMGFYQWNDELRRVWRAYRYLQTPLVGSDQAVAVELARLLQEDDALREDYERLVGYFAGLTNPSRSLTLDRIIGVGAEEWSDRAVQVGADEPVPTFLPLASSTEAELFRRLFPGGTPAGASLMHELVRAIRSGEVSLVPGPDDGWYQYQVYALESLLLTEGNAESEKLMLTAAYKRRLVEAFKAMMTKRRETHARMLGAAAEAAMFFDQQVTPRLRVEPAATFYLRTARGYRFLREVLVAALGEDRLRTLHGLRAEGSRELSVWDELQRLEQRFYGFYLVCCEDIGMRPQFLADEGVDQSACYTAATKWLEDWQTDAELAVDTRVVTPITVNPQQQEIRLWGTMGVRLAKVTARYVRPPSLRPIDPETGEPGEWQVAERHLLDSIEYVIAVDEFVEFVEPGVQVPTRDAYRQRLDQYSTKEAFLESVGASASR